MKALLDETEKAYKILKDYNGENPYIIILKNDVYAYKSLKLNDFQVEFILRNYDKDKLFEGAVALANSARRIDELIKSFSK